MRGTDHWFHVPAASVDVIDATGAGDAFCGGFLARFSHDEDPIESLLCGTVSASLCIESFGFEGLLSASLSDAVRRLDSLRPLVSQGALELAHKGTRELYAETCGVPKDLKVISISAASA
jgi:bifunctional ADP-heptose synthase (sugar kinase/adenylyltransferase)